MSRPSTSTTARPPSLERASSGAATPTELVPGVHWLDLDYVNAYLVEDGDDVVLCDAGTPWSAFAIRDRLASLGYEPADVDRVLLTHYDLDHVGALSKLDLHAPVYAGDFDASILRGDRKPPLSNHKGLLQRAMGRFVERPRLPIRQVTDREPIGSFRAYYTPGHTPGHVAYVSQSLDVGLLGDLVRERDGELSPSPWMLSYDTDEVESSIRSLADRAPTFEATCMGHGVPLIAGGSTALPTERAPEGESGADGRLQGVASRARGVTSRARGVTSRARGIARRSR